MGALIRLFIACLWLNSFFVASQENGVPWQTGIRLEWSDFKGKAKTGSVIAATTASGISYTFSALERDGYYEVDYQVDAFFYPEQSWYIPDRCDEITLAHENLHFDITELFARKMRAIMDETRFTEKVREEIRAIYNQILQEMAAFQERYDQETDFSRNRSAQLRWNREIMEALEQ